MSQIRTWLRRSGSCLCILCSSEDGSLKPWLLHLCSSVLPPNPQPLCIHKFLEGRSCAGRPGPWGEGRSCAGHPGPWGEGRSCAGHPGPWGEGRSCAGHPGPLRKGQSCAGCPGPWREGQSCAGRPHPWGGGNAVQGALVPAHRGVPLLSVILASPSSHIRASSDRPSASSPFPVRHQQGGVPQQTVRAGRECQITS